VSVLTTWTRTLNLDDAHVLLALAVPGTDYDDWVRACYEALPELSEARARELVRLVRDGFLDARDEGPLPDSLFLACYQDAPAAAQIDLVAVQWALSHPLTLVATEELVAPRLVSGKSALSLDDIDAAVARQVASESAESLRKTRTVLVGAMEEVGTLETRGTGQHRSLRASRGAPHPLAFAYLLRRELQERGADGMMVAEAIEGSLPIRLTQCTLEHAMHCLDAAAAAGALRVADDEVGSP
jgi:hypothetical protein